MIRFRLGSRRPGGPWRGRSSALRRHCGHDGSRGGTRGAEGLAEEGKKEPKTKDKKKSQKRRRKKNPKRGGKDRERNFVPDKCEYRNLFERLCLMVMVDVVLMMAKETNGMNKKPVFNRMTQIYCIEYEKKSDD